MSNDAQSGFDPRFDPAFQRGFGAPAVVVPPTQSTRDEHRVDPAPRATVESANGSMATDVEVDDQVRRVNPFHVILAALALLLVAGGLWAAQYAREAFHTVNLSTDLDFATLQMLMFAAPLAIALGVATALGLLFIYARRWQRNRST